MDLEVHTDPETATVVWYLCGAPPMFGGALFSLQTVSMGVYLRVNNIE